VLKAVEEALDKNPQAMRVRREIDGCCFGSWLCENVLALHDALSLDGNPCRDDAQGCSAVDRSEKLACLIPTTMPLTEVRMFARWSDLALASM
jgi:hypothetical protein